jgi:hypothetical protein
VRSNSVFIINGGVALTTAFITASIAYAFGLDQNLAAASFRFTAIFLITAVAFAVAGWLNGREKKGADCTPERDRLHVAAIEAPAGPSASLEPAPSHEPLDIDNLAEVISGVSPFVHVVSEEIHNAVQETEQAVVNVVTKLKTADGLLEKLVLYLKGSANDKIIPIIGQTQECLRDNNDLFDAFLAHRVQAMMESGSRLGAITDLVGGLDGIVRSIRRVARQTHLLALNATIEAARAGEAGRGFGVVATEVKALSLESDQAAKDISDGLQTLRAAITESVEALTVRHAREEKLDLDSITLRIDELGKDLKALVEHEQEIISRTQKDSEEMAKLVIDLLGSMLFQDVVSQRLNYAKQNLENIVSHSIELTASIEKARSGNHSTYTFGTKNTKASPIGDDANKKIELF